VFPRKERDQDKRVTVTEKDIEQMKKLRKKGLTYEKIAEKLRRPRNLVRAYLIDGYSKQFSKYTSKSNSKRYKNDKKFREYMKNYERKIMKEKYQDNIEIRIYQACKVMGCDHVKRNYKSLDRYRKMRIEMFEFEIKNPSISRADFNEKIHQIRNKYKVITS